MNTAEGVVRYSQVYCTKRMKEAGSVLYGIYMLLTCWLFLNGILQLTLLWHASKQRKRKRPASWKGPLPFVSVQVPVYNEKYVVEGLFDALAYLDYPRHLYEKMVLDDSTDETTALIQQKAAALRRKKSMFILSGGRNAGTTKPVRYSIICHTARVN